MKLLKCLLCNSEMDIVGNEHAINKKVKCTNPKCEFTNANETNQKGPEVLVMRKKPLPAKED